MTDSFIRDDSPEIPDLDVEAIFSEFLANLLEIRSLLKSSSLDTPDRARLKLEGSILYCESIISFLQG